MQVLLQRVGIETGHHVLDVGCQDAVETGAITGIDVKPPHVAAGRGEFGRLSPGSVTTDRGSMLGIRFDDRTSGVFFGKGVRHEVRRIGKALEETARVCRPGGILCIVDVQRFPRLRVHRSSAGLRGKRTGDVHRGFSRDRVQSLLPQVDYDEDHDEELPTTWRLGFSRVRPYLVGVRRAPR